MLSDELLAQLHQLSRAEKLRVVQLLANELAAEEEGLLTPGMEYEVWSPYDAAKAADGLMKMQEEDRQTRDA